MSERKAPGAAPHPQLDAYLSAWRLEPDGEAFATPSSMLAPVLFEGTPAMLKIATVDEEAAGGRLLVWWDGRGSAPVFRHDEMAVLLERAVDGRSLADVARSGAAADDEAMRILCETAMRLHAVPGRPHGGLTPLDVWFRDLLGPLPNLDPFYARAAAIARDLVDGGRGRDGERETVVLHGDLHHGNVLDFGADGWRAIDPKALVGDRAFDYANMLYNPDAATALAPGRLECRLGVIEAVAGIRRERMLRWAIAWGALGSLWNFLDGREPGHGLTVGRAAERLLEG